MHKFFNGAKKILVKIFTNLYYLYINILIILFELLIVLLKLSFEMYSKLIRLLVLQIYDTIIPSIITLFKCLIVSIKILYWFYKKVINWLICEAYDAFLIIKCWRFVLYYCIPFLIKIKYDKWAPIFIFYIKKWEDVLYFLFLCILFYICMCLVIQFIDLLRDYNIR